MKHSIVLQAPPPPFTTTQPSPSHTHYNLLLRLASLIVNQHPPAKKKRWPLASSIKPIMRQGGWAVSRSPLPPRLSDQNKRWDFFLSFLSGGRGGGGQLQGDYPPPYTHTLIPTSTQIKIAAQWGRGKSWVVIPVKKIALLVSSVHWPQMY